MGIHTSNNHYPPDFQKLIRRISLIDVLRHYNLLDKMREHSPNQLQGWCPFHAGETSNSFLVNHEKKFFECSVCGVQGNILDFVVNMEDCSISKANLLLKRWFVGITKSAPIRLTSKRDRIDFTRFHTEKTNPPLTFALKKLDTLHPYLLERVSPATAKLFGLGVCYQWSLANRLVIPINNENGKLIGYAGRALNKQVEELEGKYKFSPSFKKELVLFNFHRVVEFVTNNDEPLILVEGFFDVFRLFELGYPNVVALIGASLSDQQEALLKAVLTPTSCVALLFNNDTTKIISQKDTLEKLKNFCSVKVVNLPQEIRQPHQLKKRIKIF